MPSACNTSCKIGSGPSCVARRNTRRRRSRKQRGGDNTGALVQLAPVSQATAGIYSPNGGNVQQQMESEVKDALANVFGPNKIQQFGGRARTRKSKAVAAKRKGYKGRSRKSKKRTVRRR